VTHALETTGLGKSYGAVTALSALDLAIPKGLVYGVLGPNGAGKSTLLRMVLGLVTPSRGGFRLLGESNINASVLRRVGAMIEAPSLYPFLTARDMLRMAARMSGFREDGREEAVLARVGLTDAARNCISNVRPAGLSYEAAAAKLAYLLEQARSRQLSGVDLKDDTAPTAIVGGQVQNNFLLD
jgi:ABC-type multidrug transport system ATPase subunit